jgi:archaellum component FlaC
MAKKISMSMIKIDDKEYDFNSLSDEAKNQLGSIQFVDSELARLTSQIAVFQTARNSYSAALNELLPKTLS